MQSHFTFTSPKAKLVLVNHDADLEKATLHYQPQNHTFHAERPVVMASTELLNGDWDLNRAEVTLARINDLSKTFFDSYGVLPNLVFVHQFGNNTPELDELFRGGLATIANYLPVETHHREYVSTRFQGHTHTQLSVQHPETQMMTELITRVIQYDMDLPFHQGYLHCFVDENWFASPVPHTDTIDNVHMVRKGTVRGLNGVHANHLDKSITYFRNGEIRTWSIR